MPVLSDGTRVRAKAPVRKSKAVVVRGLKGDPGEVGGVGVPVGGAQGEALVKVSSADHDTTWGSIVEVAELSVSPKLLFENALI